MPVSLRQYLPPPGEAAPRARAPEGTVIFALGDLHGRDDLLADLHAALEDEARRRGAQRNLLIYLGDYFSRGHDSRAVVERVLAFRPQGWDIVFLRGNHEDLILRFLEGDLRCGRHWLDYGGIEALAQYGVAMADATARDWPTVVRLRQRFLAALPEAHRDFLRGLKTSHREGGYFFTHGGVLPGVALEAQSPRDLIWIRKRFLLSEADHGAVVVHGHCISREPEVRHNRIGIDTGAYRSGVLTALVLEGERRDFLQTGMATATPEK
jgi:serine/threonine protein phosphatase 1